MEKNNSVKKNFSETLAEAVDEQEVEVTQNTEDTFEDNSIVAEDATVSQEVEEEKTEYPKFSYAAPAPEYIEPKKEDDSMKPNSEVGVISRGTKIVGDIVTRGHLDIDGTVEGNISALGDITITGNVIGDIACNSIAVKGGVVKANLDAKGDITIIAGASIDGNIKGKKIDIEGTVRGDIEASEAVQITCAAKIFGDITTAGIAVGFGAEILGNVRTVPK